MNKKKVGFIVPVILIAVLTISVGIPGVKAPNSIQNAIDSGVAWLAKQQNLDGSWYSNTGVTGLAVLKLETYAIESNQDPLDPSYEYYTNVSNGLDYIFANAYNITISSQTAGDPDTNANGIGVEVSPYDYERNYLNGMAAMAIAASTHPEKVVNVPGSDVNGRTFKDVLQDIVDYFAFGQSDPESGIYRGGWGYHENYGSSDNSVSGYVVLGLVYAEDPSFGFAVTIPQFVKTELNYWIDYIQDDVSGGSGYTGPGYWVNVLKTGTLLQQMAFFGDALSTQRVQNATDYIKNHWNDTDYIGWRGYPTDYACYQAMYTAMKGLTAFGIESLDGDDWYADLVNVALAQQNPDGSWPAAPMFGAPGGGIWSYDYTGGILTTSWALLVLEKAAPQIFFAIESCDVNGVKKDSFVPSDIVYVKGSGYAPSTAYDLYIVEDKATWTTGDSLVRVPGTATTITSDGSGNVPPTTVWNPGLTPGKYDIVVDTNGNGKYDDGEPLDNNDIVQTAGFLVIPEYLLGAIMGLAGCFAAFGVFRISKRKYP